MCQNCNDIGAGIREKCVHCGSLYCDSVTEPCDVVRGHKEYVYIPCEPGEALYLLGQIAPW